MTINEKIERARKVNNYLSQAEKMLDLAKNGGIMSEQYKKLNTFRGISLSAFIWTGSDNPRYSQELDDTDAIKELANALIAPLEKKIQQYKEELDSLIK